MQSGDFILGAIIIESGVGYCIAIESKKSSDAIATQITEIHGDENLEQLNIEWLAGSTIKVLAQNNETKCLHFGFIPNHKVNPLVDIRVNYFEWRCENVTGDFHHNQSAR